MNNRCIHDRLLTEPCYDCGVPTLRDLSEIELWCRAYVAALDCRMSIPTEAADVAVQELRKRTIPRKLKP